MYAGERAAQLAAVRSHSRKMRVNPLLHRSWRRNMPPLRDGFYSTEIARSMNRAGSSGTAVRESLRFDNAKNLSVEFAQSVGVIGQRHKDASLYVAARWGVTRSCSGSRVGDLGRRTCPASDREAAGPFGTCIATQCGFDVTTQGFGAGQCAGAVSCPAVTMSVRARLARLCGRACRG